jgi:hypothetical protein
MWYDITFHKYIFIFMNDEVSFFITFVQDSLYLRGNNASKDEGSLTLNNCVALFYGSQQSKTNEQYWRPPSVNSLPQL